MVGRLSFEYMMVRLITTAACVRVFKYYICTTRWTRMN